MFWLSNMLKHTDLTCGTGFQPVKTCVEPASSRCEHPGTPGEAGEHSGAALRSRRRMAIGARSPPSDQGVGRYVEFFNRLLVAPETGLRQPGSDDPLCGTGFQPVKV